MRCNHELHATISITALKAYSVPTIKIPEYVGEKPEKSRTTMTYAPFFAQRVCKKRDMSAQKVTNLLKRIAGIFDRFFHFSLSSLTSLPLHPHNCKKGLSSS